MRFLTFSVRLVSIRSRRVPDIFGSFVLRVILCTCVRCFVSSVFVVWLYLYQCCLLDSLLFIYSFLSAVVSDRLFVLCLLLLLNRFSFVMKAPLSRHLDANHDTTVVLHKFVTSLRS